MAALLARRRRGGGSGELLEAISVFLIFLCASSHGNYCERIPDSLLPNYVESCTCFYKDSMVTLDFESERYFTAKFMEGNSTYTLAYQPCKSLQQGNVPQHFRPDSCSKNTVSACQINKVSSMVGYPVADIVPEMSGVPERDLAFEYEIQDELGDKKYRRLVVTLTCYRGPVSLDAAFTCTGKTGHGKGTTRGDPITYACELKSEQCCLQSLKEDGKISAGSVLLILLFVGLLIYFVCGLLYNKLARGATGPEIIPNYEFWKDLPALLKEGCLFFYSCICCRNSSESTGYDNI